MITLILGGARSGKSTFAERIALAGTDVTYLATGDAGDAEMSYRIKLHKSRRPADWKTWEGDIETLSSEISAMRGTLLLDCLTLYLTRFFLASPESENDAEEAWHTHEREILASVEALFSNFLRVSEADAKSHLIVVSNEVGFGLVPSYRMGRRFRDTQGRANQIAGNYADNAALVVAGLPLWLKGGL